MTKRIFRSILLVALVVLLTSSSLILGILYEHFTTLQKEQLRTQLTLAAQGFQHEGTSFFDGLDLQSYRLTRVGPDGTVLYDSASISLDMENHAQREEIREALESGYGESARYSDTLTERRLYAAMRLEDGSVIRISVAQSTVFSLILSILEPIILFLFVIVAISLLLAARLSRSIVRPLNELDPDQPQQALVYEELSPLLNRIASQQLQLRQQSAELQQKKDEFEAATRHMTEGLLLLNSQCTLLSLNPSAARLLELDVTCIGQSLLSLKNATALQELLQKARDGMRSEISLALNDRDVQINASPILTDGEVAGIVLLLRDTTEKEKAERMRREFTANVSHELKTPLHTISGYAELLSGGLVRSEDIARFSGQIYTEAGRLIVLVEDILKLSRLDEGGSDMTQEPVDLCALAKAATESLQPAAAGAGVTLSFSGVSAPMIGAPQMLTSIVFNLCDNAIKYNRPNGRVDVTLENRADRVVLTVADTGIGIPEEDRERIFERFYRVDKSHSKALGGTGLGLSIVKHAAMLHHATLSLDSHVGTGTTVTVRFPKEEGET